jgi:sulfur carrier protein
MMLVINGKKQTFDPPVETVSVLLEQLKVSAARTAVELNGSVIEQHQFATTSLQDADRLEIVSFVGGG